VPGSAERDRLFWRVLVNAATKPLNVLALGAMVAIAFALNPLLLLGAAPVYGLLVAATVRDPREQARIAARAQGQLAPGTPRDLKGIAEPLRQRVAESLDEERQIAAEIDRGGVAPLDLKAQVSGLCDELVATAKRGGAIDAFLATVDDDALRRRAADYERMPEPSARVRDAAAAIREQLGVIDGLMARRGELDDEVASVQATLGTVRARLVQARIEAVPAGDVRADVAAMRDRMRALAQALTEAYGHNTDETGTEGT